jgi:hypothetical protein
MPGQRRTTLVVLLLLALAPGASSAAREATRQAPVKRLYNAKARRLPDGAIVRIQSNAHVSASAYNDLRDASMALMKKYPPTSHVYVGLGRDPAPFIAFLQAIGTGALNFPASGGMITRNQELNRHFEKLIPKSVRFGKKKIVLIDQTSSGKTHASIMPALRAYLKRTGSKTEVVGVAFYSASSVSRRVQGLSTINTARFPEVDNFLYAPYEGVVSPFDRHVPSQDALDTLTWRPEYERFKAAITKRIVRDAILDRFLGRYDGTQRRLTRAQAWKLRNPVRAGGSRLKDTPLLTVGDDKLPVLDARDYASISRTARQLLEDFPPDDDRFYVGVGRSATPIMAFLENLGSKRVAYLPIDGLDTDNGVSKPMEAKLATYLTTTIPAAVLKAGQPITLFQRALTGETLAALKKILEKQVKASGSQSRVEVLSIAPADPTNEQDIPRIDTRGHDQLNGSGYAASSKYGYHQVGKNELSDLQPRPDYARFKQGLLERMRRDGELDAYLRVKE